MLVHKCPPLSVDRDEAQRTWAATKVAPVPACEDSSFRGSQVAIRRCCLPVGCLDRLRLFQFRWDDRRRRRFPRSHALHRSCIDGRPTSCAGPPMTSRWTVAAAVLFGQRLRSIASAASSGRSCNGCVVRFPLGGRGTGRCDSRRRRNSRLATRHRERERRENGTG